MNDHKFCFIICTNNDLILGEALHYIDHLEIPDGYEVDLLTVNDAPSMTEGYNEAMASSDAKYKIYMHQDVFILNKNILSDLLTIFHADPQIGLIGVVGYEIIPSGGVMWWGERLGNLYATNINECLKKYHDPFYYVAEVDGLFMATSHDLPWNTSLLKDWDFYDAFQCINFLEHGYKIAAPVQMQKEPWCMHDDGEVLNLSNYNRYRHIFMEVYKKYLGKHWSEIINESHPIPPDILP